MMRPITMMFEWLSSWWTYFFPKPAKVLFLGCDNAGKTTLLYTIFHGELRCIPITLKPQAKTVKLGRAAITVFDLRGHRSARRFWKDYMCDIQAIVYLVDANDPERFKESAGELARLLADQDIARVPFLVLGTKIDRPTAVSADALRKALNFSDQDANSSKDGLPLRPLKLFMCSVIHRSGYLDGFKWLLKVM